MARLAAWVVALGARLALVIVVRAGAGPAAVSLVRGTGAGRGRLRVGAVKILAVTTVLSSPGRRIRATERLRAGGSIGTAERLRATEPIGNTEPIRSADSIRPNRTVQVVRRGRHGPAFR